MSFNPLCAQSVVATLPHLPERPSVVELGNQSLSIQDKVFLEFVADLRSTGRVSEADAVAELVGRTKDDRRPRTRQFYEALGFRSYTAIDVNSRYGSLVMDLNRDLRAEYGYEETFELVTNFGTGEHVFDQRRVFENAHNLTKPGGVMLFVLPFVNWLNHGFYSFHPVLFADLAAANGYGILEIALTAMSRHSVRAEPALDGAPASPTLPSWAGRSRRLALAYRGIRRVLVRKAPPTSIALTDALQEIPLSSAAPDLPLPRALDALMSRAGLGSSSDYPVMGNVSIVAMLHKRDDEPFRLPISGKYLDDLETEALRTEYPTAHPASGSRADSNW